MTGQPGQEGTPSLTENSRPVATGAAEEKTPDKALSDVIVAEAADVGALCEAFVVLLVTPAGHYRRRVFLSLHSTAATVQRAHAKGQPARMMVCRLVPVVADLDLTGAWSA